MNNYKKPIILANNELSEGVYAASGTTDNGRKCDSKYMNGTFKGPNWDNSTANIERYGCLGCPAYRWNGCGLQSDYIDSGKADSYDVDNGNRMPEWEQKGFKPDEINYY